MKYPIEEDFLFIPAQPNEEQIKTASAISRFTGIGYERVVHCICNFGLSMVLDNPMIMGVSQEEQKKISELRELYLLMGRV